MKWRRSPIRWIGRKKSGRTKSFRIITDRSFDLVALIHLDSGFFEAAFLGESLPSDYRALLPEPGAQCRFADFLRRLGQPPGRGCEGGLRIASVARLYARRCSSGTAARMNLR
jgi:hypothetical protein